MKGKSKRTYIKMDITNKLESPHQKLESALESTYKITQILLYSTQSQSLRSSRFVRFFLAEYVFSTTQLCDHGCPTEVQVACRPIVPRKASPFCGSGHATSRNQVVHWWASKYAGCQRGQRWNWGRGCWREYGFLWSWGEQSQFIVDFGIELWNVVCEESKCKLKA